MTHRLLIFLALLLLLATAPRPARAEPLGDGWLYRRPLTFKTAASDAPGDNLAWTEFYTNGAALPDGSDIRVTTADRMVVPSRLMQVSGQNDFVRLAFATKAEGPFYVWWGNPKPDKPAPELEINRGILAEIYKFPGGPIENETQVRKAFERAGKPLGAVFLPEPCLGYNPLGEEWTAMVKYHGQFKIDKPGSYEIAFGAGDRGYLAIDGQTVMYARGIPRDARNTKTLDLKTGWHTFEAAQINVGGGETGITCSWRVPAAKQFTRIPGAIFASVAVAEEGALENIKQTVAVDFSIDPAAEAFCPPDYYFQRYVFDIRLPANAKPSMTWDFSDGQTVKDLRKVHHMFLSPGNYTVTLTLKEPGGTFTGVRRLTIKDRMYARFPQPPEDTFKAVLAVLEKYVPSKMPAEDRLRGMLFFKKNNEQDSILSWGQAWCEAKEAQNESVVTSEVFDLARLAEFRKQFKEAAEFYHLVSEKPIGMDARAAAMRQYVIELCNYLDSGDNALKIAEDWRKNTFTQTPTVQHIVLGAMAYAAIARGDGTYAAKLCDDAGTRRLLPYNEQQIRQGVLTRNIENYIRTKDFDTAEKLVDQWEGDYPDTMLDGFSRLLRVNLLVSEDRPAAASAIALQHARALPNSFYAAELLFRAAEAFKIAGKPDDAKAAMDLLKQKYPESPYARDAKPAP